MWAAMNGRTLLLSALFVAVVAAAGTSWILQERMAASSAKPLDPEAVSRLSERLAMIENGAAAAQASAEDLRRRLAAAEERLSRAESARPAERAGSASSGGVDGQETPAAAGGNRPGAGAPLDLQSALAKLGDKSMDDVTRAQLWKDIAKAGLLDAVLADLEAKAKADKQNPQAQVAFAEACIAKIQEGVSGPLAGVYGNKADKAYDTALAADPEHWEARFGKAISLSFWPPIMGKQPEAIRQFETLLGQQEKRPTSPEFVNTYLLLGNLYAQSGKADKAAEIWKKGAALFPDHAGLKEKLAGGR